MDHFNYQHDILYAEDLSSVELAERFGTPCYVYSRATLTRHFRAFDQALSGIDHLICYAVKANSNLAVLNVLARLGAGFDIVSIGELERVLAAGGDSKKIIFSGVGKTAVEITRALEVDILSFNIESASELKRLRKLAKSLDKKARISIRVNPNVDAKTHPYIATGLKENKFGVSFDAAFDLYREAQDDPYIEVLGLDCHIGSQLISLSPFLAALDKLLDFYERLQTIGIHIHHLNLGGGLGVQYHDEQVPEPREYGLALKQALGSRSLKLILEPGRAIAANAGILLTRVEYLKSHQEKNFAIVDAGMNDLLRPALYQAYQTIIPVVRRSGEIKVYDVVGPVCESSDFLGKSRSLVLEEGELLAIRGAGAYGFSMSSNYNSRPKPAELMVDGEKVYEIRPRETVASLFSEESVLP